MAVDWTKGMRQVCTWWLVDPLTWHDAERLDMVSSASVTLDSSGTVHESATLEVDGDLPEGEVIVRGYVECEQRGERERPCVGTFLATSPRTAWEGTHLTRELSCHGVTKELDDDMPPVGWAAPRGADPLALAASVLRLHGRAPVGEPPRGNPMAEPWVAADGDTWLAVARSLAAIDGHEVTCDRWGRLRIEPARRPSALAPLWHFEDDARSVLMPDATIDADWGSVPNAVEATWSGGGATVSHTSVDEDELAPTSLPRRGRRVLCRVANPEGMPAHPTEGDVRRFADRELAERSASERSISFEHALVWPLPELGECVRVSFAARAVDVSAAVTRQEIECRTGVTVRCTAKWKER